MILAALHRCCAFKEEVTSSRLHGLTLVWKDLHLQVGACSDLGSTGAGCQMQDWVVGVMSHPLRPLGSTALTIVTARAVGDLSGTTGPVAWDLGRHWWWLELVVCTDSVAGANCRCLCSAKCSFKTHT